MTTPGDAPPKVRPISAINLQSLSQRVARLDHYYQARFRSHFGPLVRAVAPHIPHGATILDVGANHGKMARPLAKLPGTHVHAFEPIAYNHTLLAMVTRDCPNVTIHRFALSDSKGRVPIYIPLRPSKRISPGSAHMGDLSRRETFGTSTAPNVAELIIETDTLDAVAAREGWQRIDFVKIDVEGAESLVIAGGHDTIQASKPAIYCEISTRCHSMNKTPEDTVDPLLTMGYAMYVFNEKSLTPRRVEAHEEGERDYLFLHPERHTMP